MIGLLRMAAWVAVIIPLAVCAALTHVFAAAARRLGGVAAALSRGRP